MRIGLVLFGHLRSFRFTHDSYKELIKILKETGEVDVFCHTWDIEESVTASWWKEHKPGDVPPATVNAKEIEEKYQPVKYIIEPSKQFDNNAYQINSTIPIAGILSMLYTQQRAFELLKEYESQKGLSYDVVIKARYDLLYEIGPGFKDTIQDCASSNVVYLPSSNAYELAGSYSDIFAIGRRDVMEDYFSFCTCFNKAIQFYNDAGYKQFLPEFCMTVYLTKLNIKIKELTNLRLHILRMSGDKFQINSIEHFEDNDPLCFVKQIIEKNKEIGLKSNDLANRVSVLTKKYTSWIDKDAGDSLLNDYAGFFNGNEIENSKIKRLAEKEKNSKTFALPVFKNFFETAMRNANYGTLKKFAVARILYSNSRYGIFFFKVWKRLTFNKD